MPASGGSASAALTRQHSSPPRRPMLMRMRATPARCVPPWRNSSNRSCRPCVNAALASRRHAACYAALVMPGRSPAPLSLFALAVFAASTVEAQDALDEIVVSASRHEQRAFDAPAAVNSVGADEIRGAGPRLNISEPLRRLPGIVALERQNY